MEVRGQLLRFALVGAVNTAVHYGIYRALLPLMPYLATHATAFLLSMTGSFFLTSYITYRTRPTWRKFLLFPLSNAAGFTSSTLGVWLLVDILGLSSRYAPPLAATAAIPVTFLVSRTIMLGRRPGPARPAEPGAVTAARPR
jgi:putative flippase GtrA